MNNMEEYLGVSQAVEYMSERGENRNSKQYLRFKLHTYCNKGKLDGAKKIGTCWAIPKESIERLCAAMYD